MSNPNPPAAAPAATADLKLTGSSPAEKLCNLLGFDPGKGENVPAGVLGEAIKEIQEEKKAAGKVKAKELLTKLMGLKAERDKFKREADQKVAKMDKDIGKAWGAIERIANGQPPEDPNEKGEKSEKEKTEAA